MSRSGIDRDKQGNLVHTRSGKILKIWVEDNKFTGSGHFIDPETIPHYDFCDSLLYYEMCREKPTFKVYPNKSFQKKHPSLSNKLCCRHANIYKNGDKFRKPNKCAILIPIYPDKIKSPTCCTHPNRKTEGITRLYPDECVSPCPNTLENLSFHATSLECKYRKNRNFNPSVNTERSKDSLKQR